MSYRYSFEDLLALLHGHAPAKVDAVALHRRRVEHGHLSVGLKIHCLGDGSQFSTLVEGLGGAQKILDVNYYKHSHASLCLVLPPVGSARSAILLLECIEHFIGSALFSNPEIQIQVCSPGRLGARRSALLAIGFYLGSDTLRRYTLRELATSFAEHHHYPRGRRLVLYDAEGDFERNFDWWRRDSVKHRFVEPQLPFGNGRTDLLMGSGSRLDMVRRSRAPRSLEMGPTCSRVCRWLGTISSSMTALALAARKGRACPLESASRRCASTGSRSAERDKSPSRVRSSRP